MNRGEGHLANQVETESGKMRRGGRRGGRWRACAGGGGTEVGGGVVKEKICVMGNYETTGNSNPQGAEDQDSEKPKVSRIAIG